jgi:hypothetical protein
LQSGLLAEFETPDALVAAVRKLRALGYTRLDTFSPYAVLAVEEPLGVRRSRVPVYVLGLGLFGVALAYAIQWYCDAFDYPLDIGGRPLDSIPADVPICFETGILFASLAAFVFAWALCGLPRLHHPMFAVDGFERATLDRFWVGIDGADPEFDAAVGDELTRLGALRVAPFGEARS